MITQVYDPPVDVSWFQRELDAICRGRNLKLRIEWAPRLIQAETIDRNGVRRDYAKYPVRFGKFDSFHVGNRFMRNGICVGYQKIGGLIPPGVRTTDIAIPDIEYINPSIHVFVIEKYLPPHIAIPIHEEKRRMLLSAVGFDLAGEFDPSKAWDFAGYISAHYAYLQPDGLEKTCCQVAEENGIRCEGLMREPNERDLEQIRAEVYRWEQEQARTDKEALAAQRARDKAREIREWEDSQMREILAEARECDALDTLAQNRSRVAIGVNAPLHRTAY